MVSILERLKALARSRLLEISLQPTCGMTACNSCAAALNSVTVFNMFASSPTAVHKHDIRRALKATLAARSAMLKPSSGFPAFLNKSALTMSMVMRCIMSASSSFNAMTRSSMALKASGYKPRAIRYSIRDSESKKDNSGSVEESGLSELNRDSHAVQSVLNRSALGDSVL